LDGFIRTVRVVPIRIKQKVQEELVPKRMLQESVKRKSEKKKTPILELLEGCLCGMVNKVSTAVLYDLRRHCWIFVCDHI
jgi:hypothetical protein